MCLGQLHKSGKRQARFIKLKPSGLQRCGDKMTAVTPSTNSLLRSARVMRDRCRTPACTSFTSIVSQQATVVTF
jgi:hypothetical protein